MAEKTQVEGAVYALAASPHFAEDGICFAATAMGLYRSDDGGATWRSAYDSLSLEAPMATSAVVVSSDFASDRNVFAGVSGGILRSFDGGKTWQASLLPTPPPLPLSLVVSPTFGSDGILIAGTMEDGAFRSADRGVHWSRWNFGLLDLSVLALAISPDFANDETLLVGTETGIFRSSNGGRAWREVDFPTEFAPVLCLALSPNYAGDGTIFAGTESAGLLRSDDEGKTWARLGEGVVDDALNGLVLSPEFPAKPHLLAMLSTALLVSRDGGCSWAEWKPGLTAEHGLSAVLAPLGLDQGAPVLIGFMEEGGVLRI